MVNRNLDYLNYVTIIGAINGSGYYVDYMLPFGLIDLNCTGKESDVLDCPHNGNVGYSCSNSHDASVICQSIPVTLIIM